MVRPGTAATISRVEIVERTTESPETLVSLTPVAAEKILELMAEDPESAASVLRVAIQGGGCSGFQYGLGFDEGPVEDDVTLEQHGVSIVIDPYSAPYLKGATIDFLNGLEESGFKIDNPNAAASCGCGHSFTVAEDGTVADDAPEGAAHAGGCGSGCSH
jgi:iron-sulfur cluster assembly protein